MNGPLTEYLPQQGDFYRQASSVLWEELIQVRERRWIFPFRNKVRSVEILTTDAKTYDVRPSPIRCTPKIFRFVLDFFQYFMGHNAMLEVSDTI